MTRHVVAAARPRAQTQPHLRALAESGIGAEAVRRVDRKKVAFERDDGLVACTAENSAARGGVARSHDRRRGRAGGEEQRTLNSTSLAKAGSSFRSGTRCGAPRV